MYLEYDLKLRFQTMPLINCMMARTDIYKSQESMHKRKKRERFFFVKKKLFMSSHD